MVWAARFGNGMAACRLCVIAGGRRRERTRRRRSPDDKYCSSLSASVICPRQPGNELWARVLILAAVYNGRCLRPVCIRDAPDIGSRQWLNKSHWPALWLCWLRCCSPPARHQRMTRSMVRRPRNLLELFPEKKSVTNVLLRVRWDPVTCVGDKL